MKQTDPVKVGVVGVGHLGQHHVKHFSSLKSAALVGIFDVDNARASEMAQKFNTRAFSSLSDLLQECDAVSIVTPTPFHASVAETCINAGKHLFIEKPITKTVAEADHILKLAAEKDLIVQVGHIERLNPALLALEKIDIRPKYIEVQRLAPYNTRGTDVPVVLDLMIHDIDILLALVDSPVKNIRASGVSIMTNSIDIANARIRFENGTVASVTSSRVAKDKVRKIKVFQRDLYVTIDFLLGLTEVYRIIDVTSEDSDAILSAPLTGNGTKREIVYDKPAVKNIDALNLELKNFIASVRGTEKPIVDGLAGRNALDVAVKIHDMILEDLH